MPSLIDLRRRIRAVRSTQQITKAMKMVAASKLRRAQERLLNARPYARELQRLLEHLAPNVDPALHPLLERRPPGGPALVIVVTADRGLCGSFNANVIRAAAEIVAGRAPGPEPIGPVVLGLVGRKGRDFFVRRGLDVLFEHVNFTQRLGFGDAQAIAREAIALFTSRAVDDVYLVFNEFRSVLQQRVVAERLLPIARPEPAPARAPVEYLYEPAPDRIFAELLPRHVEVQVFRALLESAAAEHAARMTAMDSATRNSAEMIEQLTLYMNKVRQATITREIIEVVSGAEAL